MTPRTDHDTRWRKYLSTCHTGGTTEQRRFAFDCWWNPIRKEYDATIAKAQQQEKRKKAEAIR